MSSTCQNCPEHSSIVLTNNFITKDIATLKQELAEYKGFVNARLDGTASEMKELRREMIAEMNKKFDELKTLIEGKEKDKNNKMWSVVSPLVVGLILLVGQYLLKLLN